MYELSRALYRSLADDITPGPGHRQRVLEACERTVHRLATDPHYFARPARTLLREIRPYLHLCALRRAERTVERHLALASDVFARDPDVVVALTGHRRQCRAWIRKGRPCHRTPGRDGYCASHLHLTESVC